MLLEGFREGQSRTAYSGTPPSLSVSSSTFVTSKRSLPLNNSACAKARSFIHGPPQHERCQFEFSLNALQHFLVPLSHQAYRSISKAICGQLESSKPAELGASARSLHMCLVMNLPTALAFVLDCQSPQALQLHSTIMGSCRSKRVQLHWFRG
jgi:hypothetical protein